MEVVTKQIFAWLALALGLALIAYEVLLLYIGFSGGHILWIFSLTSACLIVCAGILLLRHRTGMVSTVGLVICMLTLVLLTTQFITVLMRDLHVGRHR